MVLPEGGNGYPSAIVWKNGVFCCGGPSRELLKIVPRSALHLAKNLACVLLNGLVSADSVEETYPVPCVRRP